MSTPNKVIVLVNFIRRAHPKIIKIFSQTGSLCITRIILFCKGMFYSSSLLGSLALVGTWTPSIKFSPQYQNFLLGPYNFTNKCIPINFHLHHWLHKSDFFSPSAMRNLWTFVRPARFTLVNWLPWSCVLVVGKGLLGCRMEGGNRLIQGRRSCSIGDRGRGILWWIPKLFVFLWAWIRCVVWLIWPCEC